MQINYHLIENNNSHLTSILNLKIFLFLSHKKGTCYFKELQEYLNRSKSQLSVALKKLEQNELIKKDNGRPQKISLTKRGIYEKNITLKEIMKFRNHNSEKKNIKNSAKNNTKKIFKITQGKPIKNKTHNTSDKKVVFDAFIKDVRRIVENELIEYIGARIPLEILSEISLEVRNKINDKLYKYF